MDVPRIRSLQPLSTTDKENAERRASETSGEGTRRAPWCSREGEVFRGQASSSGHTLAAILQLRDGSWPFLWLMRTFRSNDSAA